MCDESFTLTSVLNNPVGYVILSISKGGLISEHKLKLKNRKQQEKSVPIERALVCKEPRLDGG